MSVTHDLFHLDDPMVLLLGFKPAVSKPRHCVGLEAAILDSRCKSFEGWIIVTHRLPLTDAVEAYRLFDSREATKVVLAP